MITLGPNDTLRGVASVASQLSYSLFGMTIASGVETYDLIDQEQLPSSAATLYTVGASTELLIKNISIVNNDSSARTFQLYINGTALANAITPIMSIPAGGMALYNDAGWSVYDGNGVLQRGAGGSLLRVTNILQGTTTFTPGTGTRAMLIECVGAGGAGGGSSSVASQSGAGGGGGSGSYAATWTTVIKAYTVAVGTGGTAGAAGANPGNAGSDTSFDTGPSIVYADGGAGGLGDTAAAVHVGGLGGDGGSAGNLGSVVSNGEPGYGGVVLINNQAMSGAGGDSRFGGGAQGRLTHGTGLTATNYGAGGSGGCSLNNGGTVAGGAGANGLIRVWEFA